MLYEDGGKRLSFGWRRTVSDFFLRLFDHWAHLGGAAFGVWYHYYGMRMWDMFRISNLGPVLAYKKPTE